MPQKYEKIAEWIVISAALNAGLSTVLNVDVVGMIVGATAPIVNTIYFALAGISAGYLIYDKFR